MSAYSSSTSLHNSRISWRAALILFLAALISMGCCLAVGAFDFGPGFPLDDAWIHQAYARNLARDGEWAFLSGQLSAGSTSPLWTVLLSAGYLLGFSPIIWSFILGSITLLSMAVLVEMGSLAISRESSRRIPWAGLVVIFEWHFVWSSLSGMETLLHALLILGVALLLLRRSPPWLVLGLLTGLSTWVRPDGLTLLGPIVLTSLIFKSGWKGKSAALITSILGFAIFFIPYLVFNHALSGAWFPTTFYAKQAEYAVWRDTPILQRFFDTLVKFLAGPSFILIPAVIYSGVRAWKDRKWGQLALLIWVVGYLGIYGTRLPAYQHGRYLIPAMPVFLLFGLAGIRMAFMKWGGSRSTRIIKLSWASALALLSAGFWVLGLRSYTADVEFIQTEMVATAEWVAGNLPDDALIAAHDIGALGYFDHHELIDLAGLVSPEVIPFLRDENRLADYLDDRNVSYLVVFPDWYPGLTASLEPVFTTGAAYSQELGETNMTVFRWESP